MCLRPLRILNHSHAISTHGGTPMYYTVPCGHCCECDSVRKNEYLYKISVNLKHVLANGGYMLSDTLTYAPEHLPTFDGLSCFNRDHIRLFLDRLRHRLYRINVQMKYIDFLLTCEYGEDDRYTHRPHYHVTLYVHKEVVNKLSPLHLYELVAECWTYGRTQAPKYVGDEFAQRHIFFDYNSDSVSVAFYVAKYTVKDVGLCRQLKARVDAYIAKHPMSSAEEASYRYRCREYYPFTRASRGFGMYDLQSLDVDKLIDRNGFVTYEIFEDKKLQIRETLLPRYFFRKLFYDYDRYSKRWSPKQAFYDYMIKKDVRTFETEWKNNFIKFSDPNFVEFYKKRNGNDFPTIFLREQNLREYTAYVKYYKGRFAPSIFTDCLAVREFGVGILPELDEWLPTIYAKPTFDTSHTIRCYFDNGATYSFNPFRPTVRIGNWVYDFSLLKDFSHKDMSYLEQYYIINDTWLDTCPDSLRGRWYDNLYDTYQHYLRDVLAQQKEDTVLLLQKSYQQKKYG